MQKEKKSDCPVDVWLSAKICFPDGQRGFAIGKLIEEVDRSVSLILTLDQNLLSGAKEAEAKDILGGLSALNSVFATPNKNLANLPRGSAVLLAPPRLFGVKFWIARLGEPTGLTGSTGKKDTKEASITYELLELKKLKNFLEARSCPRVVFHTPILLINQKSYSATQFFSYDISQKGVSIALDKDSSPEANFEINENYLLQIQIHEGMKMPPLNYKCVHIREDIITGTKIVGFSLNDRKANDPDVEYNLTLLSWSDSSLSSSDDDKEEA